mmetsp:Transcript_20099/g.55516  ORF Transcript_20099/g.55516 Transcript_20099/m.55516 type:complete len:192 (+) Transcript_20099:694-1269(+)
MCYFRVFVLERKNSHSPPPRQFCARLARNDHYCSYATEQPNTACRLLLAKACGRFAVPASDCFTRLVEASHRVVVASGSKAVSIRDGIKKRILDELPTCSSKESCPTYLFPRLRSSNAIYLNSYMPKKDAMSNCSWQSTTPYSNGCSSSSIIEFKLSKHNFDAHPLISGRRYCFVLYRYCGESFDNYPWQQ